MESYKLTIHEARDLMDKGELSIEELVTGAIKRIENTEANLGTFVTLDREKALQQAHHANGLISRDRELSNLSGIPMGVQDNICTSGLKTTGSSRILDNFIPPYDASVIEKLKQHHAIILGKLNMDEFGIGSSTENSAFEPTKNPWDLHKVPGGAAGGGAAAVASDQVFYAIGSDATGCLRQPAAFCGVVGIKPTYGLVSRFGLIGCAPSLEQIGCITKDVTDCAHVLEEIAFHDDKDSTSAKEKNIQYRNGLIDNIRGFRIGIPKEIFEDSWDPSVRSSLNAALAVFQELGAELVDIDLPHAKYASAAHFILLNVEASSNLARYDGIRYGRRAQNVDDLETLYRKTRSEGFGAGIKRNIMLGNLFLTTEYYDSHYQKALKIRSLIKSDFKKAYEKCDMIVTPTSPILAFDYGNGLSLPIGMSESQRYTLLANLAGLPAISIPCGFSNEGLPIGMQLIGDWLSEGILIRGAYTFERNTDFHMKKPMQLEVTE